MVTLESEGKTMGSKSKSHGYAIRLRSIANTWGLSNRSERTLRRIASYIDVTHKENLELKQQVEDLTHQNRYLREQCEEE